MDDTGKVINMIKKLSLAAATALFVSGAAFAQAPNLIEIRQTGMDLAAGDFAGINALIAAKGDIKPAEPRAKAIARWAGVVPTLFPKGTETGGNTKAKAEVFSDPAGFQKAAMNLGTAATKLAETLKGGDLEMAAVDAKALGAACGACHNDYRAK